MSSAAPWLLLVAAAHLGFQLTVDLVVYPELAEVARRIVDALAAGEQDLPAEAFG